VVNDMGAALTAAASSVPAPVERIEAIKPPRLNFARLCLHCGERDCESPACVGWHEQSAWMVCPDCEGEEWTETLHPCGCMFGVVEAWPAARADADRLAAI
jgi:hypothetical protein